MGIIFIVVCALMVGFIIYRRSNPEEKKFLLTMYIIIFLLRAVFAVGYQWYIEEHRDGLSFVPDESYYLALGWRQALSYKSKDITQLSPDDSSFMSPVVKNLFVEHFVKCKERGVPAAPTTEIFSSILGFFYFIFGYSAISSRLLNVLISVLTALIVYFLAKLLFTKDVARFSFLLFAFLPSQVFFSISVLRDVFIIFFTLLALILVYKMNNKRNFVLFLIPLFFACFMLLNLQKYLYALIIAVIGAAFLIKMLDFKKRRFLSLVLVTIIAISALNSGVTTFVGNFLRTRCAELLQLSISKGRREGDTSYTIFPDKLYLLDTQRNRHKKTYAIYYSRKGFQIDQLIEEDMLNGKEVNAIEQSLLINDVKKFLPRAYLKGLFYVLFRPYPWHIKKITQIPASVNMVIWYLLFPFMCTGLYASLRSLTKEKIIFMILFFSFISSLAIIEANVGSLFRYRNMISFAYVIFAANGIKTLISGKKKLLKEVA